MGLQIGNTNIKDVKIGEYDGDITYTWSDQKILNLNNTPSYIERIGPFDRLKGTLKINRPVYPAQNFTVTTYDNLGNKIETIKTSDDTVIEFDTYINSNGYSLSLGFIGTSGDTYIFYIRRDPGDIDSKLSRVYALQYDDYSNPHASYTLTYQLGTANIPPIVYHNIKEIYAGDNKIYPVTSNWQTVWEGDITFTTTTSTGNKVVITGLDITEDIGTYRFTGTANLNDIVSVNWKPIDDPINPDKDTGCYIWYKDKNNVIQYLYDENSKILDLSSIRYTKDNIDTKPIYIMLSPKSTSSGTYARLVISNKSLVLYTKYNFSYINACSFSITKIEKYVGE